MPFDGTQKPRAINIRLLDLMIETLGENGERWIKYRFEDGNAYCLLGTYHRVKHKLGRRGYGESVLTIIDQALRDSRAPAHDIVQFNDHSETVFGHVRDLLHYARGLAAGNFPEAPDFGGIKPEPIVPLPIFTAIEHKPSHDEMDEMIRNDILSALVDMTEARIRERITERQKERDQANAV